MTETNDTKGEAEDKKGERETEQLVNLRKHMLADLDQLILRRKELHGQFHRVGRRIRVIQTQLGLPPQSVRSRAHESRLEGVRALLLQARGPMTLATIGREIEAIEGKPLNVKHTWNFLERHPRDFVNVGRGLWDLREKWSESDLAAEKKRQEELLATKENMKDSRS